MMEVPASDSRIALTGFARAEVEDAPRRARGSLSFGTTSRALLIVLSASIALESGCAPGLRVGAAAPHFTLEDLAGRKISLSQFTGTPILLNYFATW